MKKKHLHGKLSLKIKDLSAMNGSAQKQAMGGATADGCNTDTCAEITHTGCGHTFDHQLSCFYCLQTAPPKCNTNEDNCFTYQGASRCELCSGGAETCPGVTTC